MPWHARSGSLASESAILRCRACGPPRKIRRFCAFAKTQKRKAAAAGGRGRRIDGVFGIERTGRKAGVKRETFKFTFRSDVKRGRYTVERETWSGGRLTCYVPRLTFHVNLDLNVSRLHGPREKIRHASPQVSSLKPTVRVWVAVGVKERELLVTVGWVATPIKVNRHQLGAAHALGETVDDVRLESPLRQDNRPAIIAPIQIGIIPQRSYPVRPFQLASDARLPPAVYATVDRSCHA